MPNTKKGDRMFINRSQKNDWQWYSKIETKDEGGNVFNEYISFSFKKGCEPRDDELSEYGSLEGDLYFHTKDGKMRRVFPIVKYFNGKTHIEYKILGVDGAKPLDRGFERREQVSLNDGDTDMFGAKNTISPDDLPFY